MSAAHDAAPALWQVERRRPQEWGGEGEVAARRAPTDYHRVRDCHGSRKPFLGSLERGIGKLT